MRGKPDFERIEHAIRGVFDPEHKTFSRAAGHISAPVTTDAMICVMKARLAAVTELTHVRVSDEDMEHAREAHLFAYADYAARQSLLAAASPPSQPLYQPVTAEDTLNNCCRDLLTILGMEVTYPANAQRLRRARAGLRRPSPADVGLINPAESDATARDSASLP